MKVYKVKENITLELINRKKKFKQDEEVLENIWTKTYPEYFILIGNKEGYLKYLAEPVFNKRDEVIQSFLKKEKYRKVKLEDINKKVKNGKNKK